MKAEIAVIAEGRVTEFCIGMLDVIVGLVPHGIIARSRAKDGEFIVQSARRALHILAHLMFFQLMKAAQHTLEAANGIQSGGIIDYTRRGSADKISDQSCSAASNLIKKNP